MNSQASNPFLSNENFIKRSSGSTKSSSNVGVTKPSGNTGISRSSDNASLTRHSNNVEAARLALRGLLNSKSNYSNDSSSCLAGLAQTVASMELQLRRPNEQPPNSSLKRHEKLGISATSTPNFRKHDGRISRRTSFCENFELNHLEIKEEIQDTPMKAVWSSSSLRRKTPNSSFVNVNQTQGHSPMGDSYQGNAEWGDTSIVKNVRSMDPVELIKTIQRQRAMRKERSNHSLKKALQTSLTRSQISGQNLTTQFDLKRPQLSGGQVACTITIPTLPSEDSLLSMGSMKSELSDMTM